MATQQQLDDILKAANEVNRLQAQYMAALKRFSALVSLQDADVAGGASAATSEPHARRSAARTGNVPNPDSLSQRVLAEITRSPTPVALSALETLLNATHKQVRYAVTFHQKRGVVVHAGLPGQYTLKERLNLNGASAGQHSKP
jgi:hypothetical protein